MGTSGTNVFEKTFYIDDIIKESYERIGFPAPRSGYDLSTARRSLNIMFQEWANRGLHYWEIKLNNISCVQGQNLYTIYRSPTDGTSDGTFSPLSAAINSSVATIPVTSAWQFPTSGTLLIGSEQITYTGRNTNDMLLTGATRGANGTTAASHSSGANVYDYNTITYGADDIYEMSYRITNQTPVADFPFTKINRSIYQSFSNKGSQGQPTQVFVQRFIDRVTFNVYLTPGAAQVNNLFHYYYASRIQDVGAYQNITDVPYRFVPCMCAGLAYYLSIKFAPDRAQPLKLIYEDEFDRALQTDGSPSSSFITPKTYYPNI
jgi:hypothetical protein